MDDRDIIARIRAGEDPDQELLLQLWEKYRLMICKFCNRYQEHDCIEDMLQNCYLLFHEAVLQYDPEAAYSFSTYLGNRIKWNLYRRYVDHAGPVTVSLDAPLDDETDITLADTIPGVLDPAGDVEDQVYASGLMAALDESFDLCGASEDERAVFINHSVKGLDYAVCGRLSGTSGADQRQLHQGIHNRIRERRYNKPIRKYIGLTDNALSAAYHSSISAFIRTRTSATEKAALIDLGLW